MNGCRSTKTPKDFFDTEKNLLCNSKESIISLTNNTNFSQCMVIGKFNKNLEIYYIFVSVHILQNNEKTLFQIK